MAPPKSTVKRTSTLSQFPGGSNPYAAPGPPPKTLCRAHSSVSVLPSAAAGSPSSYDPLLSGGSRPSSRQGSVPPSAPDTPRSGPVDEGSSDAVNMMSLNDKKLEALRAEAKRISESVQHMLRQVDAASTSSAKRRDHRSLQQDRVDQMLRTELDSVTHAVRRAESRLAQIEDSHHDYFVRLVPKAEEVSRMATLRSQVARAKQQYMDTHERFERIEYEVDIRKMMLERVSGEVRGGGVKPAPSPHPGGLLH